MEYMIEDWIKHISQPREELGGFSVCPFAKGAEYEFVETDGSDINPPPWNFELIIYKLPESYTIDEVISIAEEYNKVFPELVFLPDPKDKDTFINGVQTNNSRFNLILCQWRDNLNLVREKLTGTKYYSYWSEEYLKEILES
jgi:hypothetical protein